MSEVTHHHGGSQTNSGTLGGTTRVWDVGGGTGTGRFRCHLGSWLHRLFFLEILGFGVGWDQSQPECPNSCAAGDDQETSGPGQEL